MPLIRNSGPDLLAEISRARIVRVWNSPGNGAGKIYLLLCCSELAKPDGDDMPRTLSYFSRAVKSFPSNVSFAVIHAEYEAARYV